MRLIELTAGTAALSVRAIDAKARPLFTRRGAKTGYASTILELLGTRAGAGVDELVWAESDPYCRFMLQACIDPAMRAAAGDVLRGWADEDPAALYRRLTAVGPIGAWSAEEVARWFLLGCWSYRPGEPSSGFNRTYVYPQPTTATHHGANGRPVGVVARQLDRLPTFPRTALFADARQVPVDDGTDTLVYIDPPYRDTTPYAWTLSRAEVVLFALRWAEVGARVAVSEAEPIPELVAHGWRALDITASRVGTTRSFSRQKREWLMLAA